MNRLNARQFPKVYEELGISIGDLGCIMLDVAPFEVTKFVENGEDDLFFGDTHDLRFAQGAVAEKIAHMTLLYGLLEKAPTWNHLVDQVLEGWVPPPHIELADITVFPSNIPGQNYSVIVGIVEKDHAIIDAHNRLSLLPHIDTFPVYAPHVTLAYVKGEELIVDKWVDALGDGRFLYEQFPVTGLNYGHERA